MQQQRVRPDVGQNDRVVGREALWRLGEVALRLVRGHVAQVEG